ncbi:Farnesyl transferase beta subunit [Carabus blaptoides fortunei]
MRCFQEIKNEKFNDEEFSTVTSEEQIKVEKSVEKLFDTFVLRTCVDKELPKLLRWEHANFLKNSIVYLPSSYACLDASRAWLCYWILHSLNLLDVALPSTLQSQIVQFLAKCQNPEGGFSGGPGQSSHLAPTYAAVNTLCIIGTQEAYDAINRDALQRFLWALRSPEGAFSMHVDGEVDIRGVYCALAVATLTNIYTPELFKDTADWVLGCQTYEGGFSGCPGMEAHGGYAFCGLASLTMLQKADLCNKQALLRWTVNRQMKFEGGFQGRTNKLVDGCYSFWQGGAFPLLHELLLSTGDSVNPTCLLFHQEALQEYILICCQNASGGLIDKPGKPRDIYHTCYALSGLSVAQQSVGGVRNVVGASTNELEPTHPVYNISPALAIRAMRHYRQLPVPRIEQTS